MASATQASMVQRSRREIGSWGYESKRMLPLMPTENKDKFRARVQGNQFQQSAFFSSKNGREARKYREYFSDSLLRCRSGYTVLNREAKCSRSPAIYCTSEAVFDPIFSHVTELVIGYVNIERTNEINFETVENETIWLNHQF